MKEMEVINYFSTVCKGEVAELRYQLQNVRKEVRVYAMRKILIAATFRNTEVDSLFFNVLNCAQTDCLKLKKLVFFYLSVTASRQPELAMMTVNTLTKDLASHLPLVRALALRTAVAMNVDELVQHLVAPLQQCLRDEDPYVRRTAALCVAKMYYKQPDWVTDVGFIESLRELLNDSNTSVVINAVAALGDMKKLDLDLPLVQKLLAAITECHEWGQVTILEAVSKYGPKQPWEVRIICSRVSPFLSHSNAAVIYTTIKILLPLLHQLADLELRTELTEKLGAPLKSLMSAEPAIQYVTLRNIQLILLKHPQLIHKDVRLFFIKYNDPIYVKLEKLEVLVQLTTPETITQVLSELKEYAGEADVQLARSATLAIGRCAVRLQSGADACVKTLLSLIETDVPYVVESAVVAFRDVFRRYPKRYEQAINALSGRIETLQGAEARAAFIWMLGEYAERIHQVDQILETFAEDFADEVTCVQLMILTAVVKAFLVMPSMAELIHEVLKKAVASPNPDLRDRAFIYWRLLSTEPAAARAIVLAEKPPISGERDGFPPCILDSLLREIGTLASVYHKMPYDFQPQVCQQGDSSF